uniref:Uncharacterized protein n=1 Tax=Anas platyrhynchos platyrhynchos TaxID=8840 RepID=A0A493TGJ0_ANAPP
MRVTSSLWLWFRRPKLSLISSCLYSFCSSCYSLQKELAPGTWVILIIISLFSLRKSLAGRGCEENQKNSCTRLELRRLDKDSTRELGAFHSLKLSKKSRRSQESRKDQEHRTALALNKILSKAKKPATTVAKKAIKRLENVKADKPKKAKIPSKGRAVKPEADKPKAEKSKVAQSKQAVHKKKQTRCSTVIRTSGK